MSQTIIADVQLSFPQIIRELFLSCQRQCISSQVHLFREQVKEIFAGHDSRSRAISTWVRGIIIGFTNDNEKRKANKIVVSASETETPRILFIDISAQLTDYYYHYNTHQEANEQWKRKTGRNRRRGNNIIKIIAPGDKWKSTPTIQPLRVLFCVDWTGLHIISGIINSGVTITRHNRLRVSVTKLILSPSLSLWLAN